MDIVFSVLYIQNANALKIILGVIMIIINRVKKTLEKV